MSADVMLLLTKLNAGHRGALLGGCLNADRLETRFVDPRPRPRSGVEVAEANRALQRLAEITGEMLPIHMPIPRIGVTAPVEPLPERAAGYRDPPASALRQQPATATEPRPSALRRFWRRCLGAR